MNSPHITHFVSQQCEETIVVDEAKPIKLWYMVADWSDGKRRKLRHWFSDFSLDRCAYYDINLWTLPEENSDE
jgi:hypothetical protein